MPNGKPDILDYFHQQAKFLQKVAGSDKIELPLLNNRFNVQVDLNQFLKYKSFDEIVRDLKGLYSQYGGQIPDDIIAQDFIATFDYAVKKASIDKYKKLSDEFIRKPAILKPLSVFEGMVERSGIPVIGDIWTGIAIASGIDSQFDDMIELEKYLFQKKDVSTQLFDIGTLLLGAGGSFLTSAGVGFGLLKTALVFGGAELLGGLVNPYKPNIVTDTSEALKYGAIGFVGGLLYPVKLGIGSFVNRGVNLAISAPGLVILGKAFKEGVPKEGLYNLASNLIKQGANVGSLSTTLLFYKYVLNPLERKLYGEPEADTLISWFQAGLDTMFSTIGFHANKELPKVKGSIPGEYQKVQTIADFNKRLDNWAKNVSGIILKHIGIDYYENLWNFAYWNQDNPFVSVSEHSFVPKLHHPVVLNSALNFEVGKRVLNQIGLAYNLHVANEISRGRGVPEVIKNDVLNALGNVNELFKYYDENFNVLYPKIEVKFARGTPFISEIQIGDTTIKYGNFIKALREGREIKPEKVKQILDLAQSKGINIELGLKDFITELGQRPRKKAGEIAFNLLDTIYDPSIYQGLSDEKKFQYLLDETNIGKAYGVAKYLESIYGAENVRFNIREVQLGGDTPIKLRFPHIEVDLKEAGEVKATWVFDPGANEAILKQLLPADTIILGSNVKEGERYTMIQEFKHFNSIEEFEQELKRIGQDVDLAKHEISFGGFITPDGKVSFSILTGTIGYTRGSNISNFSLEGAKDVILIDGHSHPFGEIRSRADIRNLFSQLRQILTEQLDYVKDGAISEYRDVLLDRYGGNAIVINFKAISEALKGLSREETERLRNSIDNYFRFSEAIFAALDQGLPELTSYLGTFLLQAENLQGRGNFYELLNNLAKIQIELFKAGKTEEFIMNILGSDKTKLSRLVNSIIYPFYSIYNRLGILDKMPTDIVRFEKIGQSKLEASPIEKFIEYMKVGSIVNDFADGVYNYYETNPPKTGIMIEPIEATRSNSIVYSMARAFQSVFLRTKMIKERYVDTYYALLRQNKIDEARQLAKEFKNEVLKTLNEYVEDINNLMRVSNEKIDFIKRFNYKDDMIKFTKDVIVQDTGLLKTLLSSEKELISRIEGVDEKTKAEAIKNFTEIENELTQIMQSVNEEQIKKGLDRAFNRFYRDYFNDFQALFGRLRNAVNKVIDAIKNEKVEDISDFEKFHIKLDNAIRETDIYKIGAYFDRLREIDEVMYTGFETYVSDRKTVDKILEKFRGAITSKKVEFSLSEAVPMILSNFRNKNPQEVQSSILPRPSGIQSGELKKESGVYPRVIFDKKGERTEVTFEPGKFDDPIIATIEAGKVLDKSLVLKQVFEDYFPGLTIYEGQFGKEGSRYVFREIFDVIDNDIKLGNEVGKTDGFRRLGLVLGEFLSHISYLTEFRIPIGEKFGEFRQRKFWKKPPREEEFVGKLSKVLGLTGNLYAKREEKRGKVPVIDETNYNAIKDILSKPLTEESLRGLVDILDKAKWVDYESVVNKLHKRYRIDKHIPVEAPPQEQKGSSPVVWDKKFKNWLKEVNEIVDILKEYRAQDLRTVNEIAQKFYLIDDVKDLLNKHFGISKTIIKDIDVSQILYYLSNGMVDDVKHILNRLNTAQDEGFRLSSPQGEFNFSISPLQILDYQDTINPNYPEVAKSRWAKFWDRVWDNIKSHPKLKIPRQVIAFLESNKAFLPEAIEYSGVYFQILSKYRDLIRDVNRARDEALRLREKGEIDKTIEKVFFTVPFEEVDKLDIPFDKKQKVKEIYQNPGHPLYRIKNLLANLAIELYSRGLLSKEALDQHLGRYLHREYEEFYRGATAMDLLVKKTGIKLDAGELKKRFPESKFLTEIDDPVILNAIAALDEIRTIAYQDLMTYFGMFGVDKGWSPNHFFIKMDDGSYITTTRARQILSSGDLDRVLDDYKYTAKLIYNQKVQELREAGYKKNDAVKEARAFIKPYEEAIKKVNFLKFKLKFLSDLDEKISSAFKSLGGETFPGSKTFDDFAQKVYKIMDAQFGKTGRTYKQFLDSLGINSDEFIRQTLEFYRKNWDLITRVPKTKEYGDFAGGVIHKGIAEDVIRIYEITTPEFNLEVAKDLKDIFSKGFQFFKMSKTAFNLFGTWVNNFISNFFQMNVHTGASFKEIITSLLNAINWVANKHPIYQYSLRFGVHEGSFSKAEIYAMRDSLRVDYEKGKLLPTRFLRTTLEKVNRAIKFMLENRATEALAEMYSNIDTLFRLAYIDYYNRTGKYKIIDEQGNINERELSRAISDSYLGTINYDWVSKQIRDIRDAKNWTSIFFTPFASYRAKILGVYARGLKERPITTLAGLLSPVFLKFALWMMIPQEDREKIVKYSMNIYRQVGAYFTPIKEGDKYIFVRTRFFPLDDWIDAPVSFINEGPAGFLRQFGLFFSNPVISTFVGVATGKDPYLGVQIYDPELDTPSEQFVKVLSYNLLNFLPTSALIGIDQYITDLPHIPQNPLIQTRLFGIASDAKGINDLLLDKMKYFEMLERENSIKLNREFRKYYKGQISQEDVLRAYKEFNERRKKILEKKINVFGKSDFLEDVKSLYLGD